RNGRRSPARGRYCYIGGTGSCTGGDRESGADLSGTLYRHVADRDSRIADRDRRAGDEVSAGQRHWDGGALRTARWRYRSQSGRRRIDREGRGRARAAAGRYRDVGRAGRGVGSDGEGRGNLRRADDIDVADGDAGVADRNGSAGQETRSVD